jgi:ribosomal subunit interface protein
VNLTVKSRNLVVTDAIGGYAEEKIGKLGKYLAGGSRCEVEIWTEKNPSIADSQVVEVTIFTKGPVIRAREASPDIYASIDLVFEKLERQVKKYRGKVLSRSKEGPKEALDSEGFNLPEESDESAEEGAYHRQDETLHGKAHGSRRSVSSARVGRARLLRLQEL